jgi:hypothetical protein
MKDVPPMKLLTKTALAATALVGLGGIVAPVHAGAVPSDTGDTTTTMTFSAGFLSIAVPASTDLGTVSVATTSFYGEFGDVTVVDNRGAADAAWTASVISTDLVGPGGHTLPADSFGYTDQDPTSTSGNGTFTPVPMAGGAGTPVLTHAGSGVNSATWHPNLFLWNGGRALAGTYTATVTHSVV